MKTVITGCALAYAAFFGALILFDRPCNSTDIGWTIGSVMITALCQKVPPGFEHVSPPGKSGFAR